MADNEIFSTEKAEQIQVNLENLGKQIKSDYNADGIALKKVALVTYDFAEDGGAIGAIGLGVSLPDNAVVIRSWVDVLETLTSGTDAATVALSVEGANDVVAAIAISDVSNPWDAGLHEGIQDGAVANAVKTTQSRELTATIAVEAVLSGRFKLFVEYVVTG